VLNQFQKSSSQN